MDPGVTDLGTSVNPQTSGPDVPARRVPRAPFVGVTEGVKHLTLLPDSRRPTITGQHQSGAAKAMFILATPGVSVRWNTGVVFSQ